MQPPVSAGAEGVLAGTAGVLDQSQALVPVGQTELVVMEPGRVMGMAVPALPAPVGMDSKPLQAPSQGLVWPWGPWGQPAVSAPPSAANTQLGDGFTYGL